MLMRRSGIARSARPGIRMCLPGRRSSSRTRSPRAARAGSTFASKWQRWRSWSAYVNASIARVRQRGPVTGGLFLEDDVADIVSGGEFIPDHDQFLVASGGWTWTPPRSGATLSFTIRHETGTPIESSDDDVEDLRSRPGAETVDFDRGRVAAENGRVGASRGADLAERPSLGSVACRSLEPLRRAIRVQLRQSVQRHPLWRTANGCRSRCVSASN